MDYYQILGVDRGATDADISVAYKKLMLQYHPDKNPDDAEAEEKAKEISQAYTALKTADARQRYDMGTRQQRHGSPSGDFFNGFRGFPGFAGFNMNRGPTPGRDIQHQLNIPLVDAIFGANRSLKYTVPTECSCFVECEHCKGEGFHTVRQQNQMFSSACPHCQAAGKLPKHDCEECRGSGKISLQKEAAFDIPPGASSGTKLGIVGGGFPGSLGGPPGNLIVMLLVDIPQATSFTERGASQLKKLLDGAGQT